jgi:hypothetical protein
MLADISSAFTQWMFGKYFVVRHFCSSSEIDTAPLIEFLGFLASIPSALRGQRSQILGWTRVTGSLHCCDLPTRTSLWPVTEFYSLASCSGRSP